MGKQRVAFLGLGNMGCPMAERLAASGMFDLAVFDIDQDRVRKISQNQHVQPATTPQMACRSADIIVLMLPNGNLVKQVLVGAVGQPGVLEDAKDALVIDMSSSDPKIYAELAPQLIHASVRVVDAPVSGGVAGAMAGTLSIMVGGDAADIQAARPVLDLLGERIFETGTLGSGQAMKALNNLLSAGTLILTLETLAIGMQNGLDPDLMTEILNVSTGRNNSTDKKVRQFILSGRFDSGFGHALMAKDVATALALNGSSADKTPLAALAGAIVGDAQTDLDVGSDHTEIAKALSCLKGVLF